jgi:hypothetical protein
MQRNFTKNYFLSMVGSVCRTKRFEAGWQIFADDEEVETEVRKWLREQFKRLLCCEFRRTAKAMEQMYECWWRICREINVFFQVWMLHVLCFVFICDPFTDSPSFVIPESTATSYYIDHYSLPSRHSGLYSRSFLTASLNKSQRSVHIRTGCLEYVTLSWGIDQRVEGIIQYNKNHIFTMH